MEKSENTATKAIADRWEDQKADMTMQMRLEYFYECWMPEGRDGSRFAADLHMLVRSIYQEASAPANKQLMEIMKCMPITLPPGIKL